MVAGACLQTILIAMKADAFAIPTRIWYNVWCKLCKCGKSKFGATPFCGLSLNQYGGGDSCIGASDWIDRVTWSWIWKYEVRVWPQAQAVDENFFKLCVEIGLHLD